MDSAQGGVGPLEIEILEEEQMSQYMYVCIGRVASVGIGLVTLGSAWRPTSTMPKSPREPWFGMAGADAKTKYVNTFSCEIKIEVRAVSSRCIY